MPADFETILEKFLMEELTPEELHPFLAAVKEQGNQEIVEKVLGEKLQGKVYQQLSDKGNIPAMFLATMQKIAGRENESAIIIPLKNTRPVFFGRKMAAAVFLLIIGAGSYLLLHHKYRQQHIHQQPTFAGDVIPGGNKATLTLANGSTILLDSTKTGMLATQGNTKISNLNGNELTYQSDPKTTTEVAYNILATPRGGQYQLTLPDGSRVWLNAASSIRYPTVFAGNERRVEITGEVYFEVAQNAAKPFKVKVKPGMAKEELEVEVLGTHFNMMAYNDEAAVNTTLLEGSVRVIKGSTNMIIKPGQQLSAIKAGQMQLVPDVDVQKTMAWKDGNFFFSNDDISTIMKQLSRWYDIDVHFEGIVNDHYTGKISRQVNISRVLKMLEAAGGVSFSIQGKEVKVISKTM